MLYVTKGNQQFRIDESEKNAWAAKGFTILDAEGKEVKTDYHAPVPYEEHIAAVEAAKGAKVKELEAKIKELEAKIKELEEQLAAQDDFE